MLEVHSALVAYWYSPPAGAGTHWLVGSQLKPVLCTGTHVFEHAVTSWYVSEAVSHLFVAELHLSFWQAV